MDKRKKEGNRFKGFEEESEESEEISDFSFGKSGWSKKKLDEIFEKVKKEKDRGRVRKILEKGLHMVVYEGKEELVTEYVEKAIRMINYEKGILDTVKRLRIVEESIKWKGIFEAVKEKIKELEEEKKEKMSKKKWKIVEEREEALIAFLSYFIFKFSELKKEEYYEIFQILEWHHGKS